MALKPFKKGRTNPRCCLPSFFGERSCPPLFLETGEESFCFLLGTGPDSRRSGNWKMFGQALGRFCTTLAQTFGAVDKAARLLGPGPETSTSENKKSIWVFPRAPGVLVIFWSVGFYGGALSFLGGLDPPPKKKKGRKCCSCFFAVGCPSPPLILLGRLGFFGIWTQPPLPLPPKKGFLFFPFSHNDKRGTLNKRQTQMSVREKHIFRVGLSLMFFEGGCHPCWGWFEGKSKGNQ